MSTKSVMLSNHLIFCHPLLFLPSVFPSIRVFSSESGLHIRWAKDWSFCFSISPSNEYSELISLRIDLVWSPCHPRDSQESSLAQQFESINSSVLNLLFGPAWLLEKPQLWLDGPFSAKWCLCFLILSRFVIVFLPRSKHPLSSWLQSLSTVILEPKKRKSLFPFFCSSIHNEVMSLYAIIIVFLSVKF